MTGLHRSVPLDAIGPVDDIWWQDDETFYVVTGRDARTMYACTMIDQVCQERLVDKNGTLRAPAELGRDHQPSSTSERSGSVEVMAGGVDRVADEASGDADSFSAWARPPSADCCGPRCC